MSEVLICDRCGDLITDDAEVRVGTLPSGVIEDVPGGIVSAVERDTDSRCSMGPAKREKILQTRESIGGCKAKIEGGDLCEDCAEAFREWWDAESTASEEESA